MGKYRHRGNKSRRVPRGTVDPCERELNISAFVIPAAAPPKAPPHAPAEDMMVLAGGYASQAGRVGARPGPMKKMVATASISFTCAHAGPAPVGNIQKSMEKERATQYHPGAKPTQWRTPPVHLWVRPAAVGSCHHLLEGTPAPAPQLAGHPPCGMKTILLLHGKTMHPLHSREHCPLSTASRTAQMPLAGGRSAATLLHSAAAALIHGNAVALQPKVRLGIVIIIVLGLGKVLEVELVPKKTSNAAKAAHELSALLRPVGHKLKRRPK